MSPRAPSRRILAAIVGVGALCLGAGVGIGVAGSRVAATPSAHGSPTPTAGRSASGEPSTPPPTMAHGAEIAPPWSAPSDVAARAAAAGLSLGPAQTRFHIHAHLSVTVHGAPVEVPAHIGITRRDGRTVYSPLHTHDTSGIVHIEAPSRRAFTLAQVFTEWDVALSAGRIGSFGPGSGDTVTVFVDGEPRAGDPGSIVLRNLDDIDVVVTRDGETAVPPSGFYWPPQY